LTSIAPLADLFTLIVPTYNRPADLARLLTYLDRLHAGFPVLVMDSSELAVQHANRETIAKCGLNVRYEILDGAVSPWEKFWRGSELVRTPYCSLCADDDLVLPSSLAPIVQHLETHPDCSVAHGWYFTFYNNEHLGITSSVYRGASLDQADPVARLLALFKNYEAVTYGVYRTSVMQSVLRDVQGVESLLGRELLGGALAVAMGKAARLPVFYYGRSLAPSQSYNHWHPLDFLISAPDGLYRDYAAYREILFNRLKSNGYDKYPDTELHTLIDLIHFRYLSDYVKPRVMEYLTEQVMARKAKPEIMQGMWSALAQESDQTLVRALSGSRLLRKIRDRFFPGFRLHHFRRRLAPAEQRKVQSKTAGGKMREYLFYKEFLGSFTGNGGLEQEITKIVAALDHYE
jgi:glycosyltransferase domain-containing protein